MNELDALGRELRRQLPDVPDAVVAPQLGRLLKDARKRDSAPRLHWFQVALSVASLAMLIAVLWPSAWQEPGPQRFFAAERSELDQVLGDGTRLHLDLGARGFSDVGNDGTQFTLEYGRATFDVAKEKGRVFSVLAGPHVVRVLGTRFSVALDRAGVFDVSVERGVVLVIPAEGVPVRLGAGERFERGGDRVEQEQPAESRAEPTVAAAPLSPKAAAPAAGPPPAPSPASRVSEPRPTSKAAGLLHEQGWRQLYLKRQYAEALTAARREGFGRLMKDLEAAELADLADVARLGGDLSAALEVLSSVERRFPATEQASLAQFLSGRVLVQLGRRREAATAFETYLALNPDGTYETEALGRLLEIHANRGDTERARPVAERYLKRAPNGPYRRLALSLTHEL